MIRAQNRKIQELYEELEKKDVVAQNLQIQIGSMETYKIQMENFKRQVSILEEKLRLYETDYSSKSSFLSDQLKLVSEAENKMRNQIVNKDKIIYDFEHLIKDQDNQLASLKQKLIDRESNYADLRQDFNEISAKFKNLTLKSNVKEEEQRKSREDFDIKLEDITREKINIEEKLAQLIDIVKQYSRELSDYNMQVQTLETEKRSLQKLNNHLNEEIGELSRNNQDLYDVVSDLNQIKIQLSDSERIVTNLQGLLDNERNNSSKLTRDLVELREKYQDFRDKHTGENSIENLRSIITTLNNEKLSFRQDLDNSLKSLKNSENRSQELESEIKELTSAANIELKGMIQWIETYLGLYYDNKFEIPDLPYTVSKSIKNRIKLDPVKEALKRSRKNMNEELARYEKAIRDLKKEVNDNMQKQEKMICETSDLKNQILEKNEEIYSLGQQLEGYQSNLNVNIDHLSKIKNEINQRQENYNNYFEKLYNMTKTELDNILRNEKLKSYSDYVYRNSYTDNTQKEVEDNITRIIQILNSIVKDYELLESKGEDIYKLKSDNEKLRKEVNERTRSYRDEIEIVIKEKEDAFKNFERLKIEEVKQSENSNKQGLEKLRVKLSHKDDTINQLQQENILLKSQLEILDKNISNRTIRNNNETELQEKVEKLTENLGQYEKKIHNLTTEAELKDMQIQSQEQMLARRSADIQEFKQKLGSNDANDINEKIKGLEVF